MARRGSVSHLAPTVSDLVRSTDFYDKVLGFMGYARVEVPEATQQLMRTRLHAWASLDGSITIRPAKRESVGKAHDRNAPGLNHMAFNATDRANVESLHSFPKEIGAQLLDPPAEYPYFPGYFAIFSSDPDSFKFEFVFWPRS